MTGIGDDC